MSAAQAEAEAGAHRCLVDAGMTDDRDLVRLFDLDLFAADKARFIVNAKATMPHLFRHGSYNPATATAAERTAFANRGKRERVTAFDAEKASAAERRAFLEECVRSEQERAEAVRHEKVRAAGDVRNLSAAEYALVKRLYTRGY